MKARSSRVVALRAIAFALLGAPLLGACAGANQPVAGVAVTPRETVKPQVPRLAPTQPPSDLGAVERFAWQQVVQLAESFAAGDVPGFLARVSRGFYRGYSTLESSLEALLAKSSARTAVVAIRMVAEEEGRVSVRAEWTRSVTMPDGSVDARHGETVFLFLRSDTSLRLLDYRGDAPFAIAGI